MLKQRIGMTAVVTLAIGMIAQQAWGHGGGDFSPRAIGGKIVLGGYDDGTFTDVGLVDPPVFGAEIGPTNAPPSGPRYEDGTPGMQGLANPVPGDQLPAGRLMSDLLVFSQPGGGPAANLFYWDGVALNGGEPVFAPATEASLTMAINSTFLLADGSMNASQGLFWGNKQDGITLHNHATSSLYRNPTGTLPAEGIYMIGMDFYMTDGAGAALPGLQGSDPVFLLFRAEEAGELLEPAHELAIEWAEENYGSFTVVPEPSTIALAIVGLAALGTTALRRRAA